MADAGNNIIKKFRYFVLTEYEEEAEWLSSMHVKGYRFFKVMIPGIYFFEKCEPEEVVYKLDFNPQSFKDKQSYVKMYEDYGWDYMQSFNEYHYFRKSANDGDADLEIFSDYESKKEMLKRILFRRMIPVLLLFILCFMLLVESIVSADAPRDNPLEWLFSIEVLLIAVCVYIITRCALGFYRLNKKYSKESRQTKERE